MTEKIIYDRFIWHAVCPYLFPAGIPPFDGATGDDIVTLFKGGYPDDFIMPEDEIAGPLTLVWNHEFTPDEHAAWDRLVKMCRRRAEYDDDKDMALEPHLTAVKTTRGRNRGNKASLAELEDRVDELAEAVLYLLAED